MNRIGRMAFLLSAVFLLFSACSAEGADSGPLLSAKSLSASTMRLVRTEGTVTLTDEHDKALTPQIDMRLFSGSSVATEEDSRAGISLDDTKAATVGSRSRASIYQDGKKLTMELEHGEMYFSVSEPLAPDERFDISTSTMTLGIRGTAGYVGTSNETETTVILVSGHGVIMTPGGASHSIHAGQMITVETTDTGVRFTEKSISEDEMPELLTQELSSDPAALERAEEESLGTPDAPSAPGEDSGPGSGASTMLDRREIVEYDSEGNRVSSTVYWMSFTESGDTIHYINQFDSLSRMIRYRADFSGGAWDETTYTYEPGSPVVTYDHNALSFLRTGPGSSTFGGESVFSEHIVYTMADPENNIHWVHTHVNYDIDSNGFSIQEGSHTTTVTISEFSRDNRTTPIRTMDFECEDGYVVTMY